MFEAAWNLFGFAPVNDVSSGVLSRFADTLAPYGDGRITSGTSSLEVIKRWEKNESDDEFGNFRKCRVALGRLLEEDKLKDSTDVALRQAYYLNRYWEKPEEVREAFEKDNDEFLDVAVENQSLYVKEDIRCELRECCLRYHSPEDVPPRIYSKRFDKMSESLERKYPEWFAEPSEDPPFHQVSDLSLRAEGRLVFLQKQMKAISTELIGIQSENDEARTSLIDKIKTVLNQSTQLILSKFVSTMIWTAIITAVLVGIIFHVFK